MPQILDNLQETSQIKCPNCAKSGIDYIYCGDETTRLGFMQVWCNECLKGIYISRAVAPTNAKFVSFDDELKDRVPQYVFVED